jgi:hypothetical protein
MNVLHLPFFWPYNGCFVHAWSVSVQYQLYLVLPLAWLALRLWQPRRLGVFTACVIAASTALRGVGQWHSSFFTEGTIIGGALELFWYSNTLTRVQVVVMGMYAAYVSECRGDVIAWLKSSGAVSARLTRYGLTALAILYYALACHWRQWVGDYRFERRWEHSAFVMALQVGSVGSGVVWCFVMLSAIHRIGVFADWRAGAGANAAAAAAAGKKNDDASIDAADTTDGDCGAGSGIGRGFGLAAFLARPMWAPLAELSYWVSRSQRCHPRQTHVCGCVLHALLLM